MIEKMSEAMREGCETLSLALADGPRDALGRSKDHRVCSTRRERRRDASSYDAERLQVRLASRPILIRLVQSTRRNWISSITATI
jgi:hypothetical protein